MPTNKTIREEFEEKFITDWDSPAGERKVEVSYIAKDNKNECVFDFIQSALISQLESVEELVKEQEAPEYNVSTIEEVFNQGYYTALQDILSALKEKKSNLEKVL